MTTENIRTKLAAGNAVFGLFTPYSNSMQAGLLARSGFDFLVLDAEHGEIEPADMSALTMACEAQNCAPIVRVPSTDSRVVGRYLDFGATGIVAPMVNSKADGEALLSAALYAPDGIRGLAQTRNLDFGLGGDIPARMTKSNAETLTIAQIETRDAIDNLDEILSLDRLDILFVGPADLSASLGVPMQFTHPDFLTAMMTIAHKVKASGKHLGVLISQPEQIQTLHALGFRVFAGYLDLVIADACRNFVSGCQSVVESKKSE